MSSGFHLTILYRVSHILRARFGLPGRIGAAMLFWLGRHAYGCAIASTARLHGGLMLPHPQGIVIGANAEVGPYSYIFQNVTFGGVPGQNGLPRVGSDSRIYAGAVLVGSIRLGDHVQIGANVVVARDVPSECFVRSAPMDIGPAPPREISA